MPVCDFKLQDKVMTISVFLFHTAADILFDKQFYFYN